jgi:hypothetical protein
MSGNVNSAFGLQPVGSLLASPYSGQVQRCYLSTSQGTAMGIGDPVDLYGTADTPGFTPEVCLATAGAQHPIYGVIVGFDIDTDNVFLNYRTASTARYCYVCIDPFMVYEVQAYDASATVLAATVVGANALLAAGSVNTKTGLSGWYLNSGTTPAADATYQVMILGAANRPNNDITAAYAVWRVVISLKRGLAPTASLGALGV